jgi:hypothetical protein
LVLALSRISLLSFPFYKNNIIPKNPTEKMYGQLCTLNSTCASNLQQEEQQEQQQQDTSHPTANGAIDFLWWPQWTTIGSEEIVALFVVALMQTRWFQTL